MYYGRKKGIIIGIVVAIAVILIAIIGVFVVLKTDLFKSNKTLFWKYAQSAIESSKFAQNTQLEDIEKLKEQRAYTLSGELTANSTNNDINNKLEKLKLTVNGEVDRMNQYSYIRSKIENQNTTIFNLDYKNTDNIYALKSDEIVTVFLGIRNENLKVLLQKIGIQDTALLPDEIEKIRYSEILQFSEENIEHINETYTNIIVNNISEDSYSRQSDAVLEKDGASYNTTSYRLDLTGTQISEILVNILSTLKTDSITLNLIADKAKELNLSEEYTTINGLNEIIENMISNIEKEEFQDISFVVYNYKGKTIGTEIIVRNEQKITIYSDEISMKIMIEDLSVEPQYNVVTIEILNQATTIQSNMTVQINIDDEINTKLDITNTGAATQGNLNTTYDLSITNEDEITEITYNQTLNFVDKLENIEKLNETNCAILNDYSQQDLTALIQALTAKITEVINQKVSSI